MRKERKDGKDKIIRKLAVLLAVAVALLLLLITLFLTMCTKSALTFEVDGQVYVVVDATETPELPEDPEKDGYVFDGWYWDKDIWEQPFTTDTPVTGNGKLYAKWKPAHEHSYGEWEVVTAATCTVEGQKKRVCSCGAEETEAIPKLAHSYETKFDNVNHWSECSVCHDKINATAHTFGEWTVVTQATCTAEGLQKRVCACGAEQTEAIPKLTHSYEIKYDNVNHWQECSVCHETVNETAHTYGDWTVVTPATCTAAGEQKHACACGAEETEAIQKLDHSYEVKHNATNHWSECSVCQDKVNVTAHSFGTWEVVTPATCTTTGEQKHVCACGAEQSEVIPKLEHTYVTQHDATNHWEECSVCNETVNVTAHSFGVWEVVTPATCTAVGEQKRVCACGAEETEVIPTVAHSYEIKHNATNHWEECTVCHEKINETAHSFGDWTVTPATCAAAGEKKHVCACGAEETEAILKLAHSYITKHDDANHWQECSVCGETSNKAAHTYENGLCTVCEKVYGTEGLEYTRITNGYSVSGIGTAGSNAKIEIPYLYKGEPVIEIGSNAFADCGFTAIAIPNSVTGIGDYAFVQCRSLTGIAIPNSVTGIGNAAFSYCIGLETITVAEGNTKYHSAGDCIIETETKTLIAGCKTSVIPTDGSVTGIGPLAFIGCSTLTGITIPQSVTSISTKAFSGCSSLTSIAIGNNVTSIGLYAFYDCSSLTGITIPKSVTSIGLYAFCGCSSLTSIEYQGMKAEWGEITKGSWWNDNTGEYTVTCTDGTLTKAES